MARPIKQISIFLAVLYLALVSMATYCVSSHEIQHAPTNHHSKNNDSHSPLCAWACQVSSKTNASDTTHTKLFTLAILVTGMVFLFFVIPLQANLRPTPARGPPI